MLCGVSLYQKILLRSSMGARSRICRLYICASKNTNITYHSILMIAANLRLLGGLDSAESSRQTDMSTVWPINFPKGYIL